MNNAVFGKTMESVRKHRVIKLVKTESKRKFMVTERNYHTTEFFIENLLSTQINKTGILIKYLEILLFRIFNSINM